MEELYQIPRIAVEAFEKTTGLYVSIHDLSGRLHNHLPAEYFLHRAAVCLAVKARHDLACVRFDVDRTRVALQEAVSGRVQVCHAGLVECVVPVWRDERLEWVLFAGPGRPQGELLQRGNAAARAWALCSPRPVSLDAGQAAVILELLRQLALRLERWRDQLESSPGSTPGRFRSADMSTRGVLVRRFIQTQHPNAVRLSDLAKYLHVSESRAGHAVREACGKSFIELLIESRLNTAEALLRHTNLSVTEIAVRSGFGDISNFHHAFRRRYRRTPHQYRKHKQRAGISV